MSWLLGPRKHNYDESSMGGSAPSSSPSYSSGNEKRQGSGAGPSLGLAQAQQIPLATDGLSDPSVPASVPKWNLILPQNPVAQLGTAVEQQLDFNIQNQDIGKIQNMLVNFNFSTASSKTPILVPTPYFVTRVDFFAPDGSTLETIYNDMLFTETCSLQTDQTVATVSPLYNFSVSQVGVVASTVSTTPINAATVGFTAATTASTTYNMWLSLNCSFLVACQPYLRGCGTGYFKVRLYLSPNLSSDGSASTQGVLTANYVNLWVQEAVLSASAEAALKAAHWSGIQYNSVVRNEYSLTMVAVAASTSVTLQLQGFFAESAGLYLMFKPANTNANSVVRTPITSMYLQDSQGRQLTQSMTAELIEGIVSPQVIAVSSYFVNSSTQTTYIFPFCTNIQRVIEGKSLGSYQLTGNERVVVQATGAGLASGSIFNAVSWDYAKLVVTGNQAKQFVLGSNSN